MKVSTDQQIYELKLEPSEQTVWSIINIKIILNAIKLVKFT